MRRGRMPGSLGGLTTRAVRAHARSVQRCFERPHSSAHSLHRPPNAYGVRAELCFAAVPTRRHRSGRQGCCTDDAQRVNGAAAEAAEHEQSDELGAAEVALGNLNRTQHGTAAPPLTLIAAEGVWRMRCDTWRRSWRRLGRTPHSAVSSAAAPDVHADVAICGCALFRRGRGELGGTRDAG